LGPVPSYPVFINCRDRLAPLVPLVKWLERAGCDEIYLVDNDSAYEPLLDWYRRTPHTVIRLSENFGKWSLWQAPGVFDLTKGRRFVYTDPDVIPVGDCPLDALERFSALLDRYRLPHKAGFGLVVDDLPDHYRHKDTVLAAEAPMWQWPLERGVYYAPIDTTFALYREGASWAREAIRTGPPYVARHDSWYMNFDEPTEEDLFYAERAANETRHTSGMAHWVSPELDERHAGFAEKQAKNQPGLVTRLRWRFRGRRVVRKGVD
jgi:hypothetical protein